MKAVDNPGSAFDFMHAGKTHVCPNGVSEWDDDTARHLQKKRAALGVRIVVLPCSEPKDVAEPEPEEEPAETESETPTEVEPEPPAEPIESVKKTATKRRARRK